MSAENPQLFIPGLAPQPEPDPGFFNHEGDTYLLPGEEVLFDDPRRYETPEDRPAVEQHKTPSLAARRRQAALRSTKATLGENLARASKLR